LDSFNISINNSKEAASCIELLQFYNVIFDQNKLLEKEIVNLKNNVVELNKKYDNEVETTDRLNKEKIILNEDNQYLRDELVKLKNEKKVYKNEKDVQKREKSLQNMESS